MKTKNQTAAPALQTALPRIPCFDVKPKRNSKKIQGRAPQKRMAAILAPLRAALERRIGQ